MPRYPVITCGHMDLEGMSNALKVSLGLRDNPIGIAPFKREEDIPKELGVADRPFNH